MKSSFEKPVSIGASPEDNRLGCGERPDIVAGKR